MARDLNEEVMELRFSIDSLNRNLTDLVLALNNNKSEIVMSIQDVSTEIFELSKKIGNEYDNASLIRTIYESKN